MDDVRNVLSDSLSSAFKQAFAELEGVAESEFLRLFLRVEINEFGSIVQTSQPRIDWEDVSRRLAALAAQTGEFAQAVRIISSQQSLAADLLVRGGGEPVEPASHFGHLASEFLTRLAGNYLKMQDTIAWDAGTFDATLVALWDYVDSTTVTWDFAQPLLNFDCPTAPIELSPEASVHGTDRRAIERLLEEYVGSSFGYDSRALFEIAKTTHFLLFRRDLPKRAAVTTDLRDASRSAVTALRISAPGFVTTHLGMWSPVRPVYEPIPGLTGPLFLSPGYRPGRLALEPSRVEEVQDYYQRVAAEGKSPQLQLALSRFDQTYARSEDADRLVDAWIALEALFLSDATMDSTFRAQLRIPHFLGDSLQERKELRRRVKVLYNARSNVVHGKPVPDLSAVAEESVNLLRRALQRLKGPTLDAEDLDIRLLS